MPIPAYMTIEGAAQGNITKGVNTPESMGNNYQIDHTDEITVIGFEHSIMVPRDPLPGRSTRLVYNPLIFTKRYDKSSPMLYEALCRGERLIELEIKWYHLTIEGTFEHYFTHRLIDALIVEIQAMMALTTDTSLGYRDHEERISMTYRKIEWEHVIANTAGSDDRCK